MASRPCLRAGVSLGLALAIAACQGSASGTGASSAPTGPSVASTSSAAAPTHTPAAIGSTPSSSLIAALELPRVPGALPAGRYTRSGFVPRVTFDIAGGTWHAVNVSDGFFDVQDAPDTPDVVAVQLAQVVGVFGTRPTSAGRPSDAADAVAILRTNPALVVVESSESRMDGRVGSQVTVENPATAAANAAVMDVPLGKLGMAPGRRLWIAFFDTSDGLIAVMVGGSVARWDAALALAEPVLESVTIGT